MANLYFCSLCNPESQDGIAHIQGLVIFVPGTKVGDQVMIKMERVMQKFAIAALAEKN
ncbi:MAG: TRAM domain-containing protein [Candidatus Methanoperedens sp.]|nr:TRAM domain-containing protein [Candidatus Methanoperedens sp.]